MELRHPGPDVLALRHVEVGAGSEEEAGLEPLAQPQQSS